MAGGKVGDDMADTWISEGGPRGGANLAPKRVVAAERSEMRRSGGSRGESLAVEAIEDVSLNDERMDGGDWGGAVVIDGGDCCRRSRRRHLYIYYRRKKN